jgi:hypothetical protein
MSFYICRHCSGFILIMMFVCHTSAGLSAPRMSSHAISGREKKWIQTFIFLVSAIWDQRQMSFILLLAFLCEFFNCMFKLKSILNWTLQSIPLRPIACDRPGNDDNSITESEVAEFVVCPIAHNAFSSTARWRKHYRPDFMEVVLETTLTITQLTLFTQTL